MGCQMSVFNRFAIVVLAVSMACFSLFSCSRKSNDSLAAIKSKGEITIATSPDFPPFEFIEKDGNITGIEIELFKRIAADIGVKVKVESVDFDAIIPSVVSGKYDLGVSGFSITEERKRNVLFCNPYTRTGIALVVRDSGKALSIKSASQLKGMKVSVQSGTTSDTFCNENGLDVNAYQSNTEAELALASGKVDVWAIDNVTGKRMVDAYNRDHSSKLRMLDDLLSYEEYAFIAAKGSDTLVNAINARLDKFRGDGTVDRLFEEFSEHSSAQ